MTNLTTKRRPKKNPMCEDLTALRSLTLSSRHQRQPTDLITDLGQKRALPSSLLHLPILRRVRRSAGRRAWKDSPLSGRPKRLSFFFKREPTQRPHFPAKFKPEATFALAMLSTPFRTPHPAGVGGRSGLNSSGHADVPVDGPSPHHFIDTPASTCRGVFFTQPTARKQNSRFEFEPTDTWSAPATPPHHLRR